MTWMAGTPGDSGSRPAVGVTSLAAVLAELPRCRGAGTRQPGGGALRLLGRDFTG